MSGIFLIFLAFCGACYSRPILETTQDPFSLYAYGTNINGLSIFYADGQAQLGDMSLSNATKKISISVTFGTNNTWIAQPASTSGNLFESILLGLSQSSALANPVSFTDSTNSLSGDLTDVWELYGSYVLLTKTGANFYAKTTSEDGWYILLWSLSVKASLDYIPITLTTNAPVVRS